MDDCMLCLCGYWVNYNYLGCELIEFIFLYWSDILGLIIFGILGVGILVVICIFVIYYIY